MRASTINARLTPAWGIPRPASTPVGESAQNLLQNPAPTLRLNHQSFRLASRALCAARERTGAQIRTLENAARLAIEGNDPELARWAIEAVLLHRPNEAGWWLELGRVQMQGADKQQALLAWKQCLRHARDDLTLIHRLGRMASASEVNLLPRFDLQAEGRQAGRIDLPASEYQVDGLATRIAVLSDELAPVISLLESAVAHGDYASDQAKHLAHFLQAAGMPSRANCVRGRRLAALGRGQQAMAAFALTDPGDTMRGEFVGWYIRALRQVGDVVTICGLAGIEASTLPTGARVELAEALTDEHEYRHAKRLLASSDSATDSVRLALESTLLLPAVPLDCAAAEAALNDFAQGVAVLEKICLPPDAQASKALVEMLHPAFYLAYQTDSAEAAQSRYAQLVERWVKSAFPEEPTAQHAPPEPRSRRIRIGYATSYASFHTVMRYFGAWLERADRKRFEIHLFPLASERDWMSDYLAGRVDVAHPGAMDTGTARRQILDSRLDLLVFPEVGIDPLTFRLASLRLAPIQCVAWGHPVSTGFREIDYFLTSELLEPKDAAARYSERLVILPGIGACVPAGVIAGRRKSRAEFGFADGDVVLLSPQSLFKYRPCDDGLFPRIAAAVDCGVLVFVEGMYPAWTRSFLTRLRSAFDSAGVSIEGRVRIIPRQAFDDFLALLQAGDLFLDCLGWSGGMTSLDALAVGLPVVTLPGATMRSRQSTGMLRQLGIEETIATDVDHYVEIVSTLGADADRRRALSARILAARKQLFEDCSSVSALEGFYRWVTGRAEPGDETLFTLASVADAGHRAATD